MTPQTFAHAELLCARGQYREALESADRELQHNPRDSTSIALRSICLAGVGRFDAAVEEARRALAINPATAHAHYAIAATELRRGCQATNLGIASITYVPKKNRHLTKAAEAIAEALRFSPRNIHFHTVHARILASQHQTDQAIAALNNATALDPQDPEPLTLLAELLLMSHKNDQATATIDRAIALSPGSPNLHFLRGHLLLQAGHRRPAGDAFLEAMRLDPRQPKFRNALLESLRQRVFFYRLPKKTYLQLLRRFSILPAALLIIGAVLWQPDLLRRAGINNLHPILLPSFLAAILLISLFSPSTLGNYFVQFQHHGFRALTRRELLTANLLLAAWATYFTAIPSFPLAPLAGMLVFAASLLLAISLAALTGPRPSRSQ